MISLSCCLDDGVAWCAAVRAGFSGGKESNTLVSLLAAAKGSWTSMDPRLEAPPASTGKEDAPGWDGFGVQDARGGGSSGSSGSGSGSGSSSSSSSSGSSRRGPGRRPVGVLAFRF